MNHLRVVSHPSKPSQLERDLEESVRLVDLVRAGAVFVRPEELPSDAALLVTHGGPYWLTDKGMAATGGGK